MVFYINSNHRINYYATQLPLRDSKSYFVTAMSPAEILPLIDRYGGESILVLSQREWTASLLREPALRLEILGEQRGPVKCAPRCDMILIRARSVKQEQ
jgi:hypothetical protein